MRILDQVFQILSQHGLVINKDKSTFLADNVTYLGLEFGPEEYRPSEVILPQIESYERPTTRKHVQSFLGKINYYRAHLHNLAKIAAPLYDLTKKSNDFRWGSDEQQSFEDLKCVFKARIVLAPIRNGVEYKLYTDASGIAWRCVDAGK